MLVSSLLRRRQPPSPPDAPRTSAMAAVRACVHRWQHASEAASANEYLGVALNPMASFHLSEEDTMVEDVHSEAATAQQTGVLTRAGLQRVQTHQFSLVQAITNHRRQHQQQKQQHKQKQKRKHSAQGNK